MPRKENIVVFVPAAESARADELQCFFAEKYHAYVSVMRYRFPFHVPFSSIEAYTGAIGSICLYRMSEAEEAVIRDDWHNAGRSPGDIICCPESPAAPPMVFFRGQLSMG